jgi:hypothetical protein
MSEARKKYKFHFEKYKSNILAALLKKIAAEKGQTLALSVKLTHTKLFHVIR